jgi:hypothetical protein
MARQRRDFKVDVRKSETDKFVSFFLFVRILNV